MPGTPSIASRRVILLIDDNKDTERARSLLKNRRIKFSEVSDATIRGPKPPYPRPSLIAGGVVYKGLNEIRFGVNFVL